MIKLNNGNIPDRVEDRTCNGQCSRCGDCCGLFIPFTDKELDVIKKYVSKHNIQPYNRINVLTGAVEARCCFYNVKEKRCTIYPARPYVCRDFTCSRKNWLKYRDGYEDRAKYNSTRKKMIMATFDDMIYGDYTYIMTYLLDYCKEPNGLVDSEKLVLMINYIGRPDLFKQFTATNENGEKFNGIDLLGK